MALTVQLLALLSLLIIGFLTFRYFPIKLELRSITAVSMLVLLSVVLAFFSVMIPLFGFPSLKIGFSQLPLMMIGVFFGPSWAFIAGLIEDLLEVLLVPSGFPFLGFTLNKVLIALLPALWMMIPKGKLKEFKYLPQTLLSGILALALYYIVTVKTLTISKKVLEVTMTMKISTAVLCVVLVGFMVVMMNIIQRYFAGRQHQLSLTDWAIAVLSVEIIVNMILTPIWLQTMYSIPLLISVAVRLIKACVMVQLNIVIGYFLINTLEKIIKNPSPKQE